jgi:hypothetical protein
MRLRKFLTNPYLSFTVLCATLLKFPMSLTVLIVTLWKFLVTLLNVLGGTLLRFLAILYMSFTVLEHSGLMYGQRILALRRDNPISLWESSPTLLNYSHPQEQCWVHPHFYSYE